MEDFILYDDAVLSAFLDNQLKLYPKKVANDKDEANEFLNDVCAAVLKDKDELLSYLSDESDISGLSFDEVLEQDEVFIIPDGRFLVVE